jgi:hypothetical protein
MNSKNIAGISITAVFLLLFNLSFYLRHGYIENENIIISVMMILCILGTMLIGKKIED